MSQYKRLTSLWRLQDSENGGYPVATAACDVVGGVAVGVEVRVDEVPAADAIIAALW